MSWKKDHRHKWAVLTRAGATIFHRGEWYVSSTHKTRCAADERARPNQRIVMSAHAKHIKSLNGY